jgi:hypothetical protein
MKSRKKMLSSLPWLAGHIALLLILTAGAWSTAGTDLGAFDRNVVMIVAALVVFGWIIHKAWMRMALFTPAEAEAVGCMLHSLVVLAFMVSNLFFDVPGISGPELMKLLFLWSLLYAVTLLLDSAWLMWMHGHCPDPEDIEHRLDERQAAIKSRALMQAGSWFASLMIYFVILIELDMGQRLFQDRAQGWLIQYTTIFIAISGLVYGFTALRYYAVDRLDDDGLFWRVLNVFLSALPVPRDIRR